MRQRSSARHRFAHWARKPPSIVSDPPTEKNALSESMNSVAATTSSGSKICFVACLAIMPAFISSSPPEKSSWFGVLTEPGTPMLTQMIVPAHSLDLVHQAEQRAHDVGVEHRAVVRLGLVPDGPVLAGVPGVGHRQVQRAVALERLVDRRLHGVLATDVAFD